MAKGYLLTNDDGSYTGIIQKLSGVTGVDLKTTGPTTLYTVPAGKTLVITGLIVRVASVNTFATPPTARVGKAAAYTEYMPATALAGLNTVGMYVDLAIFGSQFHNKFNATDVVAVDITIGAGATTLTADFDVIGYLY